MLTLVRAGDTMTSIASRLGMFRTEPRPQMLCPLRLEFDALSDQDKESVEGEFSARLARGTAHEMHFYPLLAELYLGETVAA